MSRSCSCQLARMELTKTARFVELDVLRLTVEWHGWLFGRLSSLQLPPHHRDSALRLSTRSPGRYELEQCSIPKPRRSSSPASSLRLDQSCRPDSSIEPYRRWARSHVAHEMVQEEDSRNRGRVRKSLRGIILRNACHSALYICKMSSRGLLVAM